MNAIDVSVRPPMNTITNESDDNHNSEYTSEAIADNVDAETYNEVWRYNVGSGEPYADSVITGTADIMSGRVDNDKSYYYHSTGPKLHVPTDPPYVSHMPEGQNAGGDISRHTKDGVDGYITNASMLVARSYDESLTSALTNPAGLHDVGIKSETTSSFSGTPRGVNDFQVTQTLPPINGDFQSAAEILTSGKHASSSSLGDLQCNVNSSLYSGDGQSSSNRTTTGDSHISEQLQQCLFNEEQVYDTFSNSVRYVQGPLGKELPLPYESTAYATSSGLDYDMISQSSTSFTGFERRELEGDTSLPIANIGRLMKSVLPGSAKIAKQAKDIIRECVTEFILFISSEASDICTKENRKTLSADDILVAMNTLGFEHYNEALRNYHSRWRDRDHSSMIGN
ncbi:Histone-like transcription factor (CBF/NF-Y) and archaeal histone family protein [Babesia bovis T2Bo]|uniref:Histone-like transcription factor domain containing protein n=1 Tax=Babesia bovis TaxID=5865 RepID=A7AX39_BABBO|nr:Histone-like transcription factor (CBF/NF-Y) and archaeal histone family protein [Babesia bovis T2Bo]EDO05112.1 Histone-like transcription factor (CBF/NF-Y) and archaeal histone family protein [Babesia bovis T2Bo]|eukprot:XP_001608680.1 histone-like transcription factor domain containing protein [Babesia bovis T2Bo]